MPLRPRKLDDQTAEPTKVRDLVEARGHEHLHLPPYSPDLNPLEEACSPGSGSQGSRRFAKIKNLLRKAGARSRDALVKEMGSAISALTSADVRDFFEHCGYRTLGHPF